VLLEVETGVVGAEVDAHGHSVPGCADPPRGRRPSSTLRP
jgi:hypothetical protein